MKTAARFPSMPGGTAGTWRPDGYRQVPQQRIRQHSHAIEVDEDGRMAEERQPIAHLVSSDVAR